MKNLMAILLLYFGTLSGSSFQTPEQPTMRIGTMKIWLGMSKVDFQKALSAAGYVATEVGGSTVVIDDQKNPSVSFTVRFKAGRVSYASRPWRTKSRDDFEAIMGALTTLDGRTCVVSHEPVNEPDINLDRVLIDCGVHSVLIENGKLNTSLFSEVSDQMGRD
jgi:hypothetical protein